MSASSAFTVGGVGSSGSYVYLKTLTANNSASLDFAQLFSSAYKQYLFLFNNLVPATNAANLECLLGTGAMPTYVVTGYSWSNYNVGTSPLATSQSEADDTSCPISYNGAGFNYGIANAGSGLSGQMFLCGTNGTNNSALADFNLYLTTGTGGYTAWICGGFMLGAATYTSIRFIMSAGNIASGSIDVYGISTTGGGSTSGTGAAAWLYSLVVATVPQNTASNNIASITDTATGLYTINFETPFASANYAIVSGYNRANDTGVAFNPNTYDLLAGSFNSSFTGPTGPNIDPYAFSFACFGAL